MNRNIKITVGLGLFLLLLSVFFFFFSRRAKQEPLPPRFVVRTAPLMGIDQPEGVVFSYSAPPSLPRSLPRYAIQEHSRGALESKIQENLRLYNIPSSPSSLLREGVFTKTWLGEGATLALNQERGVSVVSFHQFKAISPPGSPVEAVEAAQAFILGLISFPGPIRLTRSTTTQEAPDGLLILDSFIPSSIDAVSFTYDINGYPVVFPPHKTDATTVLVDNYGLIRAATVLVPPRSLTQKENVQILTSEEVLANLSEQKGSILFAGGAFENDTSGKISFSSFLIDKTTLVYARHENALAPAFILHGVGTNNQGTSQEATFFLWASE